ncbi:uncharacterized protein LOC125502692 [Dendroctonus ponderosae]|uniref:uncharacterized protein LOC125502692 n=1 Tax=Dendroctonus ponderosae TaxID=77166 RepID=UPI0020353CD5|nr:uncharacterized protein LOC125502692 [Dendroctonus ponderosae]KAH1023655.1 hypothetical protein HUJ04_012819 [Dendroctonus ponderosae]KAH1030100.1 hypothetical protein HUJ05_003225 [Dendroctonus ponderosae]
MNSLNDTMQAIQQLIWNPEKKTFFGKNGVSWCSIGLGTLVIAAIILIFYQSIRDVKKARRKQDSKIKSYPQQLQTSRSAEAANAFTQQNAYTSNTINPHKHRGSDSVRPPTDTLEDAGGSKVLKKRAIMPKYRKSQNKNILEIQASTQAISSKLNSQNLAMRNANDEVSTSQNQPRSVNPLKTDILNPPLDGISPLARQNYSGRQLTTKDINRFIIEPTKANPHFNVRFVHNSKFQAQRMNNNQLSTSDDQNHRVKSAWQASTSYMSARRIKGQDPRTKDDPEIIKLQTPKLDWQPRNIEQAQIIKRQGPRSYRQFSGFKPQATSGNKHAPRVKQQAPRTNTKIPKTKAPKMEKEATSNPEPPKQKPEMRDDFLDLTSSASH